MTASLVPEPQPAASTSQSSPQSIYEASTQFRHWRFSPEDLAHMRTTLNEDAVSAIRNAFEADSASRSQFSLDLYSRRSGVARIVVQCLLPQCRGGASPRQAIRRQNLPALWPLPLPRRSGGHGRHVSETFLSQEHRDGLASKERHVSAFILSQAPVSNLVHRLTALFLATKTSNHPISLEAYASHIPKTAPSDVLDLEFLVAQSLGFDFAVWHPHRALWGIWLDVQVGAIDSTFRQLIDFHPTRHFRTSRSRSSVQSTKPQWGMSKHLD